MSEPEPEPEQTPEEGAETEQAPTPPQKEEKAEAEAAQPRQVVLIKTPLDRPEFDFFLTKFMAKLGLTDRKQTAIMLSNMFYDMGLDPYSDLDDIMKEMERMSTMLAHLPNTPTTAKVKDTIGGAMAARAGREILRTGTGPRVGLDKDEMQQRMERIMDKYMPMVMAMRMISEMARGGEHEEKPAGQIIPDSLKLELDGMKKQLEELAKSRKEDEIPAYAKTLQDQLTQVQNRLNKDEEERKRQDEERKRREEIEGALKPIQNQLETLADTVKALDHREPPPQKDAVTELVEQKENLEKLGIIRTEPVTPEGLPPETHIASKTLDKGEKIITRGMEDVQKTISDVLEYQIERERRAAKSQAPTLSRLSAEEKLATLQEAAGEASSAQPPKK